MSEGLSLGLLLPALVLGALGWIVPQGLSRVWAEGVGPLLALGFVATLLMLVLATLAFLLLYAAQGAPVAAFFSQGTLPGLAYFARLGLLSALIWAPILVLSVANLPRHWKEKTW